MPIQQQQQKQTILLLSTSAQLRTTKAHQQQRGYNNNCSNNLYTTTTTTTGGLYPFSSHHHHHRISNSSRSRSSSSSSSFSFSFSSSGSSSSSRFNRCFLSTTTTTTTKTLENDDDAVTTTTSTSTTNDLNIDETNPNTVIISPEHVPWRVNRQYIVQPPTTKVQQQKNTTDDITNTTTKQQQQQQQHQTTMVLRPVPDHIVKPVYATTGDSISSHDTDIRYRMHHMTDDGIPLYNQPSDTTFINYMRHSSQIAATVLQQTCYYAQQLPSRQLSIPLEEQQQQQQQLDNSNRTTTTDTNSSCKIPYKTTDDIDVFVHDTIIQQYNCYPSPLNYAQFPKSVCTSVNEIICHGIPSKSQFIQYGDIVSIDISCYTHNKVHGDNCATIIVGDYNDQNGNDPSTTHLVEIDHKYRNHYRNYIYPQSVMPPRTQFATTECYKHFIEARKLVRVTYHALMQSIASIRPNISYLSDIGHICQTIAEQYGYSSVTKYRGHGIGYEFHTPPFIKHYTNQDHIRIQPGMIFTIEPMICQYKPDCYEWTTDQWTVSTIDHGLSAQFEHTILVTNTGVEILTLPIGHPYIHKDYVFSN